jgi:predicted metal-dependent hydrolase
VGRFLRSLGLVGRPKPIAPELLVVAGEAVTVSFKRNQRARRLILRLSRDRRGVVVTLPPRVGRNEALEFARKSSRWIENRLKSELPERALQAGAELALRGESVAIVHSDVRRGAVTQSGNSVVIAGEKSHLKRRLVDWLKAEARRDLAKASAFYADAMGVRFHRLSVRDQKSRWGSCSADGTLCYSWRLVMAPPFVLDYVAAHEVAHLRYMNHGRNFWRLVLAHCPEAARAKAWLKRHGAELHAFV